MQTFCGAGDGPGRIARAGRCHQNPTSATRTPWKRRLSPPCDSCRTISVTWGSKSARTPTSRIRSRPCCNAASETAKTRPCCFARCCGSWGLKPTPALVETDYRKAIAEWLATTLAFNHLVVQLRPPDGHIYWLDPTETNQGGTLDDIFFPDYGDALVIKEDTDSLTKITPQGVWMQREKTDVTGVVSVFP